MRFNHNVVLFFLLPQDQKSNPMSSLNIFKQLLTLRSTLPALKTNSIKYSVVSHEVFSFLRVPEDEVIGNRSVLVAINFSNHTIITDYTLQLKEDGIVFRDFNGVIILSTRTNKTGVNVDLRTITLKPNEALVIFAKTETNASYSRASIRLFMITCFSILLYLFSGASLCKICKTAFK